MSDERSLQVARGLTISYLKASTLILAAAGLLGVLLRWSQAVPEARVGDNFWYAMMTAHGLGAFVGWAGFAVMGLGYWVLASVGFPVRGFGLGMARLTWWLMVLGVAGVIVTTLFMGFGASWVFLYPLPFYGSGNWGDWATGLFSLSVLLGRARDRHLVPRDPPHGHQPRGARQRLGLDLEAARALVRLGLPDAAHVRDEGAQGAVSGDPAGRDRARHDHCHPAARRPADLADPAVAPLGRSDERPAREEHSLVVRPPGRLPPALPCRRRLLLADPALRRA